LDNRLEHGDLRPGRSQAFGEEEEEEEVRAAGRASQGWRRPGGGRFTKPLPRGLLFSDGQDCGYFFRRCGSNKPRTKTEMFVSVFILSLLDRVLLSPRSPSSKARRWELPLAERFPGRQPAVELSQE